jgi:CheY-like chemotaxis protein
MLFTDVVMPGTLKSPELARKARERLPNIAVLFTSGYTENSIVHGGKLDAGVELLSKPYTREALARKVRHVLANQQQRNAAAAQRREPEMAAVPAPPAAANARRTVLLVEDDALIRMNTAEIIEEAGFVVVDAGSAEEAMAALQTAPVDILVTDINLPGASGTELAARARELRPQVVVVFATGDASTVAKDERASILVKPYGEHSLLEVLGVKAPASQPSSLSSSDTDTI